MIGRLAHHADVIALKRDSYRLKNHDLGGSRPRPRTDHDNKQGVHFTRRWQLPLGAARGPRNRGRPAILGREESVEALRGSRAFVQSV